MLLDKSKTYAQKRIAVRKGQSVVLGKLANTTDIDISAHVPQGFINQTLSEEEAAALIAALEEIVAFTFQKGDETEPDPAAD